MKRPGNRLGKKILSFLAILTVTVGIVSVPSYAMEDGAYVVSRTTSYANPETGQIVDGGSDQALGDSMCAGIVENQALVEQSGGKTYVTLGLGLASNVSDVRIQVQTSSGGGYQAVGLTQTGSCSRDGDTCVHYRFEVVDPSLLISPIMYVTPMGREVQFFVRLNMGSAQAGTGKFVSQMIQVPAAEPAAADEPVTAENTEPEETSTEPETEPEEEREVIIVDIHGDPMEGVAGLSLHIIETEEAEEEPEDEPEETSSRTGIYIAAGIAVLAATGGGLWFYKKRKGGL